MTTRTHISETHPVILDHRHSSFPVWSLVLAGIMFLALISAVVLFKTSQGAELSYDQRVNTAATARLQGLADAYAAREQRVDNAATARLQGLADAYTAQPDGINAGWTAMAARYQAYANYYLGGNH